MSRKLIAMGNVLMGDDQIAIKVAQRLETELSQLGIEVIYMETDSYYGISMIKEKDYLIVLDGANLGNAPGVVTLLPNLKAGTFLCYGQHEIHFLGLLQFYNTNQKGVIIAIEIEEAGFGDQLSQQLKIKFNEISSETLKIIKSLQEI